MFTASSSLANATIYNSMCTAVTTTVSTASVFHQSPISAQAYVTGSTAVTSRNTTTSVDSRASALADSASGNVYRSSTVPLPPGSLSSHAPLSSGQVFRCYFIVHPVPTCLSEEMFLFVSIQLGTSAYLAWLLCKINRRL